MLFFWYKCCIAYQSWVSLSLCALQLRLIHLRRAETRQIHFHISGPLWQDHDYNYWYCWSSVTNRTMPRSKQWTNCGKLNLLKASFLYCSMWAIKTTEAKGERKESTVCLPPVYSVNPSALRRLLCLHLLLIEAAFLFFVLSSHQRIHN